MALDVAMLQLAARQHSVISRAQARELGATREKLRRRVAGPVWDAATPQVLRLAGSRPTFSQRCMVAVLEAGEGAVVSHTAAALLHGLPGFVKAPVDVTRSVLRHKRALPGGRLHESTFIPDRHVSVVDDVPVTTVARTLFDLAAAVRPGRCERALDNALARRMVQLETVRRVTIELLARGRQGSALMRELLTVRAAGYIPAGSGLEADFLALLVVAGLELPVKQLDTGADRWVGRVDFAYRAEALLIEVDSDLFHSSHLDQLSDRRRDADLEAAGWRVHRVKEADLRGRPAWVVEQVRLALRVPA